MNLPFPIVFSAFTASLAGFLFGFDTVVNAGAEQTIQSRLSVPHWRAMYMNSLRRV